MNRFREENSFCYFHPTENVVGVCALCLHERLLVLASKQGHHRSSPRPIYRAPYNNNNNNNNNQVFHNKPPSTNSFPKIFALTSFLNRRLYQFRPWKSDHSDDQFYASSSPEDSFISMKFEENGLASWEKNTMSKVSLDNYNKSWNHNPDSSKEAKETTKTVIEHGKPRASSFRWRKRIGHLFQLIRWKRSNKGSVCHVNNKVEGVKVRKSWIRTLTKRSME